MSASRNYVLLLRIKIQSLLLYFALFQTFARTTADLKPQEYVACVIVILH